MRELAFGAITFEVYRPPRQELSLQGITVEQYEPVPPPRVSLRGITFEQHRFSKRRRLFKKQWW
jgi:hypothetical protein